MGNNVPIPESSLFLKGLLCRCPRCGKGKPFAGFLGLSAVSTHGTDSGLSFKECFGLVA
ncbi:hypothetical protein SAMN04488059_13111 [Devosia psychrophila]|uniref:Uncharacterized protein n=1 Tax=Devosia psychrophila TaxID=728005 RepID=A0A1I1QMV8_9HYPH|nr:hypothetical protein SAMN04488059_13111 [Devosia psychrophila]